MVSALWDPWDGVSRAVERRRWVLPLLLVSGSVSLSGAAVSLRWDAAPAVARELSGTEEIKQLSEREFAEKVQLRERVRLVAGVAAGVFAMPLGVLGIALALKLSGWLFGARAGFSGCFTAAAVAMLPVALYHFLLTAAALRQVGVTDSQLGALIPASLAAVAPAAGQKLSWVLSAADFFNLWSAALLGLGFASAAGIGRGRGLLFGFSLYAVYAGVFLIGLPGLAGETG
ncbi:MAG: YIP1 family protein [Myxococcales bacterium]|nr:YIP1 family protein [Myxococcales bacterium]